MAKTLYFQSAPATTHRGDNTAKLAGAASWWTPLLLAEARGAAAASATGASIAGTTVGIEFASGTTALEWLSEPLSADFTIAGTITGNLWGFESTMNDNTAINFVVDKIDGARGTITEIARSARVTELATASGVNNFTVTPVAAAIVEACQVGAPTAAIPLANSANRYAQSFVASDPSNVDQVVLYLGKFGAPTDNYAVAIQADSAGVPSGTDLTSGTFAASTVVTAGADLAVALTPYALTPGLTYWIVVKRVTGVDGTNYVNVFRYATDVYAGGVSMQFASGAWGAVQNDVRFGVRHTAANVCKRGDRLRIRPFIDDIGSAMIVGTTTFRYNGATAAADGDSYVTFTENLTFEAAGDPVGTSTYYLTDTAETINPGAATEKKALTTRGSGQLFASTSTVNGPTAPIQVTATLGGTAIEWYTPALEAFTLGGKAKFNIWAIEWQALIKGSLRAEVAVTAGDGTGAVVWGAADIEPGATGGELPTTASAAVVAWVSGDDVAVTAGQRLRFRIYVDDTAITPLVQATPPNNRVDVRYNGATPAALGDTYVILPVAVVEQSTGPTTWTGAATVSLTDARTTAATRQTFAAAAAALVDLVATAGSRKAVGAAAVQLVDVVTTAGLKKVLAAAAVQLVDLVTTGATRQARGAAAVQLVDSRITSARLTAKTGAAVALTDTVTTGAVRRVTAAAAVQLTNARTTAARVTARSGAAVALTASIVTAAVRKVPAAAAVQLTNARVTAARVTAKTGAAVQLVDTITTTAVGHTTHLGAAAVSVTVSRTTSAVRRTTAAATVALTNTRTTAARVTFKAASATVEVVSRTTSAVRRAVAATSTQLVDLVTTGTRLSARSATATAEVVNVGTNGQISGTTTTHFAVVTVALVDQRTTAARRTTFGASSVVLTDVRATAARVTFKAQATVVLTNSRTTTAVRAARASASVQLANVRLTASRLTVKSTALARPETVTVTTNGTATVGHTTYLGAAAVQLLNIRTTSATRRTFAASATVETVTATTRAARVWFGRTSTVETVTVTAGATSVSSGQVYVQLRVGLSTSADNIVPLPPGFIDYGSNGRILVGRNGRIDSTNRGHLGRPGAGRIGRTVTHA